MSLRTQLIRSLFALPLLALAVAAAVNRAPSPTTVVGRDQLELPMIMVPRACRVPVPPRILLSEAVVDARPLLPAEPPRCRA